MQLALLAIALLLLHTQHTQAIETCFEYDTVTVSVTSGLHGSQITLSGSVHTLHEIESTLPAPLRLFRWDQYPSLFLNERSYTTIVLSLVMPGFCDCWSGLEKDLTGIESTSNGQCVERALCQPGVVPALFQAAMLKIGFNMQLMSAQGYSRCLKVY